MRGGKSFFDEMKISNQDKTVTSSGDEIKQHNPKTTIKTDFIKTLTPKTRGQVSEFLKTGLVTDFMKQNFVFMQLLKNGYLKSP